MTTNGAEHRVIAGPIVAGTLATVVALATVLTSTRSNLFDTSTFTSLLKKRQGSDTEKGRGKANKEDEEGEDSKYEVKKEFYSIEKGTWRAADEKDDDDGDDESAFVFIVRQRTWPKSAEYADEEDYTNLEIRSAELIDFLRSLEVLQEIEGVHEDKPSVDEKDLYLVRKELAEALEKRKQQLRINLAKADTSSESETTATEAREHEGEDDDDEEKAEEGTEGKSEDEMKQEIEHVSVLLGYIEKAFASTTTKLARMLQLPHAHSKPTDAHSPHAQISFNLLWAVFAPNSLVVGTHEISGEKYAFKVKSVSYTSDSCDGPHFEVSGYSLAWNGTKYARKWCHEKILKFKALRRLSTLPVVPLNPRSKVSLDLSARGHIYTNLSGSPKFLKYDGVLSQVVGYGSNRRIVKMRAEGRAMVDAKSFQRMNPMSAIGGFWDPDDEDDAWSEYDCDPSFIARQDPTSSSTSDSVSRHDLVLLPPTVYAFSLALREWGEMSVLGFEEIEFRDDAWDRLVIDQDYKALIRSLVGQNCASLSKSHKGEFDKKGGKEVEDTGEGEKESLNPVGDIIEGKGGGLVIALHGLPGVGKTLTAEAVAESLKVPLYTVGAGSLGTTADILEKRLRDILDIASAWGATLLIDEADVFLEARAKHDIQRNALVSVFLRLLEYHSGVLFLTTNRIRNIDEAFLSRFSLAITYPNLDAAKRLVIWKDFLQHAGIGIKGLSTSAKKNNADLSNGYGKQEEQATNERVYEGWLSFEYLEKLSKKKDFNGRVIKNIVRTAQSLSRSEGVALSERHLDVVIKANEAFVRDYKEADEEGVYEVKGEGWKDHTNVYG